MSTSGRVAAVIGVIAVAVVGAFLIGRATRSDDSSAAPAAPVRDGGRKGPGLGSAVALPPLRDDAPEPVNSAASSSGGSASSAAQPSSPPVSQPATPRVIEQAPPQTPPAQEPAPEQTFGGTE